MDKKIVVFTGAGVSAESGIKTFRESDGLWEEYDVMEVATPQAWAAQPKLVLEFYNARRRQIIKAEPNDAHRHIAELEKNASVQVVTQNIDNLHERAGSSQVLHLHGEIMKSKSSIDHNLVYDIHGEEIKWGETCELGSQLRPHVVWFGEEVPAMEEAARIIAAADILLVIGTSLNVYPAAGLILMARPEAQIYVIDPGEPLLPEKASIEWIKENAGKGMEIFRKKIGA